MLLNDRFWTPITAEENAAVFQAMAASSEDGLDRYLAARELNGDEEAIEIGASENWKRKQAPELERQRTAAEAALLYAKEWIQQLYKENHTKWGYVCLYDAAAQEFDPGKSANLYKTCAPALRDQSERIQSQMLIHFQTVLINSMIEWKNSSGQLSDTMDPQISSAKSG
ncbi:hypothetical protein ONS95_004581 [Cadophora gregata]|uniref:uncharacterized protein n=1 Tax=Cadophora gregata TaxID=51156 RepID=UPI0026DB9A34|nr:uncharacterized protein ONS95_004581 [Cadophora gregata]KAK0105053.1 hypothetical protein ONS96_004456 [Cadophora gregata f. sp. sojae]KAK0106076.1 hypothetical protein ONS95_004581 [Cadophora gregata]